MHLFDKKKNRIRRGLFKALSWVVLNCSIPVNFFKGGGGGSLRPFEGSPRRRTSRGPLALDHTLNYFVTSCPILRSFSFLSSSNKFTSEKTKHGLD